MLLRRIEATSTWRTSTVARRARPVRRPRDDRRPPPRRKLARPLGPPNYGGPGLPSTRSSTTDAWCSILSCPPAVTRLGPGDLQTALPRQLPDPDQLWERTERAWRHGVPDLSTLAAGESRHSYAVLRGLTGSTGAMVAAATTSLPERADQGRNYDYRYAWIRDQCYAGQAAAAIGDHTLLDGAVRFVSERVLTTDQTCARPTPSTADRSLTRETFPCPDTPAHLSDRATGSTTSSSSTHSVKRCCSSRPRMAAADSPTTAARRSRPWSRRSGNERTNPTLASGRSTTAAGPTHDSCAPPGSAPRPPPAPRTRETPSPGADRPTARRRGEPGLWPPHRPVATLPRRRRRRRRPPAARNPRSGRSRRPSQPLHRHRGPRGPDRRRLRVPVPPAPRPAPARSRGRLRPVRVPHVPGPAEAGPTRGRPALVRT